MLKTGTIKVFNIKQYFIRFYIESEKKETKVLELPYPFKMEIGDNNICTFNYRLTSICDNHTHTVTRLSKLKTNSVHKIYDNNVRIIPLN